MGVKQRWEKGQAVLHIDDRERPAVTNTYGSLRYTGGDRREDKAESKNRYGGGHEKAKQGFVLEAREAPGTPGHTEREKHLSMDSLKKVKCKEERFLYSSELPFRNQSFFYDISEKRKSREFLDCMKCMLEEQGHAPLRDTFGFLEQEPERLERQRLEKERLRELTLEEFDTLNKRLDDLNGRLRKKEAKERQLCCGLQLMIDRGRFDINTKLAADRQERGKKEKPDDWKQAENPLESKKGPEGEENESHEEDEEDGKNNVTVSPALSVK